MELTNEVYDAVNKYFRTLSHIGYKPDKEVDELIVFIFIEELLHGPLSQFVTDGDYSIINDSLYCLYGTCLIPYPNYKESFTPVVNGVFDEHRITETEILRNTEDSKLRTKV